jgi:hypothetical protein
MLTGRNNPVAITRQTEHAKQEKSLFAGQAGDGRVLAGEAGLGAGLADPGRSAVEGRLADAVVGHGNRVGGGADPAGRWRRAAGHTAGIAHTDHARVVAGGAVPRDIVVAWPTQAAAAGKVKSRVCPRAHYALAVNQDHS